MRPILKALILTTLSLYLSACGDDVITPTPASGTPTLTAAPTATPTPTPTPTPTAAPICGDGLIRGLETCDDGDLTPGDGCSPTCEVEYFWQCAGEPSLCVADENSCGDGLIQRGEQCDDGGTSAGDGCSEVCVVEPFYSCVSQPSYCTLLPPACGDGLLHPEEECDDGNLTPGDGCSFACDIEPFYACDGIPSECALVDAVCGDGALHPLEACDNGELNSDTEADACRTSCLEASCGDGVVDLGEGCDDGALNSDSEGASCRTTCRLPGCGDGVLDEGEACDDGPDNDNSQADACRTNCVDAFCGDGVIDRGEACDSGDNNSDIIPDACRSTCELATCGDGTIDEGELCDDADLNSDSLPGRCRSDCVPASCGDGIIDPGEACDEGPSNEDGVLGSCTTTCNINLSYEKVLTLSSSGTQVLGTLEGLEERIFEDAASCVARFDDRVAKVHAVERFDGGLYLDLAPLRAFVEGDPSFDNFAFVRLAPGQATKVVVTKRSGHNDSFWEVDRDISSNPTMDTAVDVFCERTLDYERVAIFAGDGSSLLGTFGDLYHRVVEEAQDCKASVQGIIFPIVHVDYDDLTLRMDALSLSGGFRPRRETYAFAEVALGTRAGLALAQRRSEVGNIWKTDRDQSTVQRFDEAPVTIFCADRYELVSNFIPSGQVSEGEPWEVLYSQVVEEGRRCKVDFDSRLATPDVVYFTEGRIDFELGNRHSGLGEGALESTSIVTLEAGVRTGITGLHRAGDPGFVIRPLVTQAPESGTSVQDFAVKVFCEASAYSPQVFAIDSGGQQVQGEWSTLFSLLTQEGVQCRLRSVDSINNPVHLEYESGTLNFDYIGLSSLEGRGESYATHILEQLSEVVFAASTRPDDAADLLRRDRDQGGVDASEQTDLTLICR